MTASIHSFAPPRLNERAAARREALLRHVSASPLGLPPLLEKRRKEVPIVDEAFQQQCVYERIYIHQVSRHEGETMGDGSIIMPDDFADKERMTAPMGIIVGAGLGAMDALTSNGIQLGDICTIARLSPYRIPIKTVQGIDENLLICEAGDIIASFDLAERLRNREVRLVTKTDEATGVRTHYYVNEKGETWVPTNPWPSNG